MAEDKRLDHENQEFLRRKTKKLFSRRTTITFESFERSLFLVSDVEGMRAQCNLCDEEITWITPNQALALSGLPLREIFRQIEAGEVHFNETSQGLLFICPRSLIRADSLHLLNDPQSEE